MKQIVIFSLFIAVVSGAFYFANTDNFVQQNQQVFSGDMLTFTPGICIILLN